MLKAFLFSFDDSQVTREEIINLIDDIDIVVNWLAFLPGSIVIISENTPRQISSLIRKHRKTSFRFIITQMENRSGWLPKSNWEFIKNRNPAE